MGYRLSIDAISCDYYEDKDILNIFNNPIEFEDENFLVYWC